MQIRVPKAQNTLQILLQICPKSWDVAEFLCAVDLESTHVRLTHSSPSLSLIDAKTRARMCILAQLTDLDIHHVLRVRKLK